MGIYCRAMRLARVVAGVVLLAGCSGADPEVLPPEPGPSRATPTAAAPTTPSPPGTSPTPAAPEEVRPADVRLRIAGETVRHLVEIGPRPGTSRQFHEAAEWVATQFRKRGWDVQQQSFPVPAGFSEAGPTAGLPVEAGRSTNVIATRGDVVAGEPWLLVGAHLDTVPTSPGAEDNASGVGALMAVADAVAGKRTRLPVVLVAFGAEEPRGPSDDDHQYGSRAYVAELTDAERRSLRGMVALDRVGQRGAMPIGSAEPGDPLVDQLMRAAGRVHVPVVIESGQRSSDHWSFVRAGLPGIRIGSIPYAGYHSADDVLAGVDRGVVRDVARIVVSWLR